MPLFQEVEFFADGTQVQRDGIPDMGEGFLLGVPSLMQPGSTGQVTVQLPSSLCSRTTEWFIICSLFCYKYTARPRDLNGIPQTWRKRTAHKQGKTGQIEENGNQR